MDLSDFLRDFVNASDINAKASTRSQGFPGELQNYSFIHSLRSIAHRSGPAVAGNLGRICHYSPRWS